MLAVDLAVCDDQYVEAAAHCVGSPRTKRGNIRLDTPCGPGCRVSDVQLNAAEFAARDFLDNVNLRHRREVEHGLAYLEAQRGIHIVDVQKIRFRPDE